MRLGPLFAPALLGVMLTGGCSFLTSFDDEKQTEDSFQTCRDGSDNDSDGLFDCDDDDCVAFSFCEELTLSACGNGKDDDGDGYVDCQDKGCKIHDSICSENTFEACTNGKDDDDDDLIDCKDSGCRVLKICQETTAAACSDKIDNDSDGLVDCLDYSCFDIRASCCKISQDPFSGDDFSYKAPCKNDPCPGGSGCCTGTASSCCTGTHDCKAFDPSKWVIWGRPRPRLEQSRFMVNEPCSCDTSGLVSVQQVHLVPLSKTIKTLPASTPVLQLKFNLTAPASSAPEELICAGITTSDRYADSSKQCSVTSRPRLLAGICLKRAGSSATPDGGPPDAGTPDTGPPDAGSPDTITPPDLQTSADLSNPVDAAAPDTGTVALDAGAPDAASGAPPHLSADAGSGSSVLARIVIDGQTMLEKPVTISGAIACTIEVSQEGVIAASAGSIDYRSQTGIGPNLTIAKVVIYGHGTTASLDSLVVKDEGASSARCQDPGAWERHLSRGAPVIQAVSSPGAKMVLTEARQPSVVFNAKNSNYLMAFAGKAESRTASTNDSGIQSASVTGIFWAKSSDGLEWTVNGETSSGGVPTPVIKAGAGATVSSPELLQDGALLHLWYAEQLNSSTGAWTIRHATSTDGLSWTADTKPGAGLAPAGGSAWDALSVYGPAVLKRPDGGGFYMWYTGTAKATGAIPAIGLASSSDGSTWTREGKTPLLSPKTDSSDLAMEEPDVVWDLNLKLYRMWHTYRAFGRNPSLSYLVSTDGKSWIPWTKGPVYISGVPGSFDERGVLAPSVQVVGNTLRLWYGGLDANNNRQIGYGENRGSR